MNEHTPDIHVAVPASEEHQTVIKFVLSGPMIAAQPEVAHVGAPSAEIAELRERLSMLERALEEAGERFDAMSRALSATVAAAAANAGGPPNPRAIRLPPRGPRAEATPVAEPSPAVAETYATDIAPEPPGPEQHESEPPPYSPVPEYQPPVAQPVPAHHEPAPERYVPEPAAPAATYEPAPAATYEPAPAATYEPAPAATFAPPASITVFAPPPEPDLAPVSNALGDNGYGLLRDAALAPTVNGTAASGTAHDDSPLASAAMADPLPLPLSLGSPPVAPAPAPALTSTPAPPKIRGLRRMISVLKNL